MIRQAVILAAGKGSRIREHDEDRPKPLHVVAGLSLLKRTALTLARGGVARIYVVVGFRAAEIRALVDGDPDYARAGLSVEFIDNPEFEKSNGCSVLAARGRVDGPFLLSMCDHVYDPSLVRLAAGSDMAQADLHLCVDRRLRSIYDVDDATKVKTAAGRIVDIGKHLVPGEYDCVDCGVFAVGPALLDALDAVRAERGDCSLSEGVRRLADNGRARVADIGDAFWQDVDTPGARVRAEDKLLEALRKPTDGPVARLINRRVSLALTRLLLHTRVTPNQMTFVSNAVGFLGVFLTVRAAQLTSWSLLAVGALMLQFQSILDGCDGEIARLKYKSSRFGEWLDNVLDDQVNVAFGVALGFATSQLTGQEAWAWVAVGTAVCLTGYNALVYAQLALVHRSGNPFLFRWWFQKDGADLHSRLSRPGSGARLARGGRALARRDVFILAFLLLCAVRLPQVAVIWYGVIAVGYFAMTIVHVLAGGFPTPASAPHPAAPAVAEARQ